MLRAMNRPVRTLAEVGSWRIWSRAEGESAPSASSSWEESVAGKARLRPPSQKKRAASTMLTIPRVMSRWIGLWSWKSNTA